MTSDSVQTVLENLRKPLEFASRDGFSRLKSLVGMEALVPSQVDKLLKLGIPSEQGRALLDLFRDYDRLEEGEKRLRISKAMQLLDFVHFGRQSARWRLGCFVRMNRRRRMIRRRHARAGLRGR